MTTVILLFVTIFISILFAFALFSRISKTEDFSFLDNKNFYPLIVVCINGMHIIAIDGKILNPFSIVLCVTSMTFAIFRLNTLNLNE